MIVVHGGGNKTVNSISERNNILRKFDGMEVTVLNAEGDPLVGSGKAIYIYVEADASWVLQSTPNDILKSNDEELDTFQEIVDYIKLQNNIINEFKIISENNKIGTY